MKLRTKIAATFNSDISTGAKITWNREFSTPYSWQLIVNLNNTHYIAIVTEHLKRVANISERYVISAQWSLFTIVDYETMV